MQSKNSKNLLDERHKDSVKMHQAGKTKRWRIISTKSSRSLSGTRSHKLKKGRKHESVASLTISRPVPMSTSGSSWMSIARALRRTSYVRWSRSAETRRLSSKPETISSLGTWFTPHNLTTEAPKTLSIPSNSNRKPNKRDLKYLGHHRSTATSLKWTSLDDLEYRAAVARLSQQIRELQSASSELFGSDTIHKNDNTFTKYVVETMAEKCKENHKQGSLHAVQDKTPLVLPQIKSCPTSAATPAKQGLRHPNAVSDPPVQSSNPVEIERPVRTVLHEYHNNEFSQLSELTPKESSTIPKRSVAEDFDNHKDIIWLHAMVPSTNKRCRFRDSLSLSCVRSARKEQKTSKDVEELNVYSKSRSLAESSLPAMKKRPRMSVRQSGGNEESREIPDVVAQLIKLSKCDLLKPVTIEQAMIPLDNIIFRQEIMRLYSETLGSVSSSEMLDTPCPTTKVARTDKDNRRYHKRRVPTLRGPSVLHLKVRRSKLRTGLASGTTGAQFDSAAERAPQDLSVSTIRQATTSPNDVPPLKISKKTSSAIDTTMSVARDNVEDNGAQDRLSFNWLSTATCKRVPCSGETEVWKKCEWPATASSKRYGIVFESL